MRTLMKVEPLKSLYDFTEFLHQYDIDIDIIEAKNFAIFLNKCFDCKSSTFSSLGKTILEKQVSKEEMKGYYGMFLL